MLCINMCTCYDYGYKLLIQKLQEEFQNGIWDIVLLDSCYLPYSSILETQLNQGWQWLINSWNLNPQRCVELFRLDNNHLALNWYLVAVNG